MIERLTALNGNGVILPEDILKRGNAERDEHEPMRFSDFSSGNSAGELYFCDLRGPRMKMAAVLLLSSLVVGQTTPAPPEAKHQTSPQYGGIDILTDTQGVDFGPYLKGVTAEVRENWYRAIRESDEMKKAKLAIEFAINRDGEIADMRLVAVSGDVALDRAAWIGIISSNPFPALPSEFKGSRLALRFRFYYNPDKSDLSGPISDVSRYSMPSETHPENAFIEDTPPPTTKSGVSVTISTPAALQVPLGGSKPVSAYVTGTGTKDSTILWSLSGMGCSGESCGEIAKGSYHAPSVMPNPPIVTLTASAKADPSAKASVVVHILPASALH